MSKNMDSDSEVDIYGDLPNFSSDNTISELENAKKNLENELKTVQLKLKETQIENDKLKKENEALSINISSLYKTATCELKRKDHMIQELRKEKDAILFRRHRNETQKHPCRHAAQPEEVHIIDDDQPSVEKEVYIIEENRQQDYTSYQYAADGEQDENYGEDEVIATFPEENEDVVLNTPQEVPDTIFSRRKAQQLKLLMKKLDSREDARSEDPEIIIEDSKKAQSTIFDRRKNKKQKSCSEQHDISKAIVETDTTCLPALDDHAFNVKEKSSTITAGTKNICLSYKTTELSASKHLDSVRKTVEVNVKTSSMVNKLTSASVKCVLGSRTEDVKVSRTKSYHKPKEHSDIHKSHREKHSHASSKDKRSGCDTHSPRKSSSSSMSKFSTHSSSHRSPTKNSFPPRSPKGRSIRETSVSRALKSLRSRSQLKDLDYKSSRSLDKRDRHKELYNEDNKKGESRENKKTDPTIVKSQISPKLIPEKSQLNIIPLPATELDTENVSTKSKLTPDNAKPVTIADSKISSINQDIYIKTKRHSEKHNCLQQERLAKSNEKEQYSTQTDNPMIGDNASCEESNTEVQTDKMSHKEGGSKTLTVSSMQNEDITEVQVKCSILRQEGNSEVMTDKKTLNSEVPTNSDKLHKVATNKISHIAQNDSVNKVSKHSSSENKNISEIAMGIDPLPKKHISEMPAVHREVTEDISADNDEQHKESVTEKFTGGSILHNNERIDINSVGNEDIIKDSLISVKRSNDSNITSKTILSNLESEVSTTHPLLKSKISTNNITPTELKMQDENAKPIRENAETLQESVTTNQKEVGSPENSDLSSNMHAEESILSSSHEENKLLKTFHVENLQNAALKDRNKQCSMGSSKNSVEIEPLERPIDATQNVQLISSTPQTDIEERNTTLGISEEASASLPNKKDSNPSLQEQVSESLGVEKEHIKSVNQSLPNPNESFSPTSTFKKGNISFAVMNEPGCFRRRKFKRISSDNSSNTGDSNVTKKTVDEYLHNENLRGTKRPYEHLDTESSVSPPVKKQAFADPQRDPLYPLAIKDKSGEDSSQRHFESNITQPDEKNTSVTETNASNDKNNTSDLEEGEVEDSDNDEKITEGNKKLNKDVQGTKGVKSIIHTESNIRKEQSRKYLELDRKARENRRKSHGSHHQEVARGNHDKYYLPKKLFSHCKRRSPSELLIKKRNIKAGTKEKDRRSRSTSSETSRNTNEFNKNEERLKARYRTKENKIDTKSKSIREERKEMKDKEKVSSTDKSILQNMHVNKQKDLSAWTRLGNCSRNESGDMQSSRKENIVLHGDNRDSFKIPAISNQTVTPVTKYIIKRRKVCNLQDNVSVPVVNISPPKLNTTAKNESFKSVHLKPVASSTADMQVSRADLIPPRKTDSLTHSKEAPVSKTSTSARPGTSQTNVNCNRISADNKNLVRSCKALVSQVSCAFSSSSSSSEYENNSDETWNPKRRRKRKGRRNPKTEVTKNKANEISL